MRRSPWPHRSRFPRLFQILLLTSATLLAAPLAHAQEQGPLVLAKSSYFFVGGEGWAQYFVRRGYAVYVVDQVARGRSAYWSDVYGRLPPSRLAFVEQRFVEPEAKPMWPQAHLHTQFPGNGKPGDASFDQFYASQFPSIPSFAQQQELNRDALVALLDKIGPALLLTHSQSGAFGWPVADARPNLVKAILAVEPSGPPVHDIENLGPPDWFKDAERTKNTAIS